MLLNDADECHSIDVLVYFYSICLALVVGVSSYADVVGELNRAEDHISSHVHTISRRIDEFFSRDDTFVEETGTRVKVSFLTELTEYENPAYDFALGAKLVLPKTQEKLHLLLFSDEEDVFSRREGVVRGSERRVNDSVEKQRYRLGLRQLFHSDRESAVSLDGGIKIRFPLDPFIRLTGRRSFFFDEYELRIVDKLYWFESEGWGTSASIDFDRPLNTRWLARLSNNGDLDHETGLWEFNHFAALYFQMSQRTAWAYYVGFLSDNASALAVQKYYVAVNYRYALIPNWLFLQLAPEVFWPRERDWQRLTGLLIRIESVFGG